jgi:hypothetical protein
MRFRPYRQRATPSNDWTPPPWHPRTWQEPPLRRILRRIAHVFWLAFALVMLAVLASVFFGHGLEGADHPCNLPINERLPEQWVQ